MWKRFFRALVVVLFGVVAVNATAVEPPYRTDEEMFNPEVLKALKCGPPAVNCLISKAGRPGMVFFPGEPVTFTMKITRDERPITSVVLGIQEVNTRKGASYGDKPVGWAMTPPFVLEHVGEARAVKVPVEIAEDKAGASAEVAVKLDLPDRYTCYVITAAINGENAQYLGSLVRVMKPLEGFHTDPPIMGEGAGFLNGGRDEASKNDPEARRERLSILSRLGYKVVRWEFGGMTGMKQDGTIDWKTLDLPFQLLEEAKIKLCVTLGAVPYWAMAADGPTATITTQMQDHTPAPKSLDLYEQWVTAFCQRYWKGGNGALWAIECWNEPWEPLSCAGWESDGPHYREVFKRLSDGAHKVDPKINTVAACSIMNTEDKFLTGDDRADWMKRISQITDHYVMPPTNYGAMVARKYGKAIFETETWGVTTDMMTCQFAAQFLACGDTMINPTNSSQMYYYTPGARDETQLPKPVNVSLSALNHFLTGRPFQRMLFLKSVPFAFQFGADPDAVVMLLGRLRPNLSAFGGGNRDSIWWQMNLSQGGTMTIDNSDGKLEFYDVAGNRVYENQKLITLPMDLQACYIRSAGGVAVIQEHLAAAKVEGIRPVEIIARDFSSRLDAGGAQLRTTLHNLLNRPISGTLNVAMPEGVLLKANAAKVDLAAGETKDFVLDVAKATASPANAYDVAYDFQGPDGTAQWKETLHVLMAKKTTKTIDGNLDDWNDDLPVLVRSTGQKVDATLQAWQPFNKFVELAPDGSFAEMKVAYDDDYFYVGARVNRPAESAAHVRVANWDENSFFHNAADDAYYESALAKYQDFFSENLNNADNVKRLEKNPKWAEFQAFMKEHPELTGYMKGDQLLYYFSHRRGGRPIKWADVSYVYKKDFFPDGPFGGDVLIFGIDAIPGYAHHDIVPDTDRVPEGFHAMPDTDFEYSAYACDDGKAELWRLLAPGVPRGHHMPRQARAKFDQGPVAGGKCVVKREGKVTTYEMAIPWSELKGWKPVAGESFGFTFKAGSAAGPGISFGEDKSATKSNGLSLHPYWEAKPSCGVRWTLGK